MRVGLVLIATLLARLAVAQTTDTTRRGIRGTIIGVVQDSIARRPLAGATVQIVDADSLGRFGRTTFSDSLGRFTFNDVPAGRYTLGFFHPMLDSLGVAAPLREVYVVGPRPVRADLAIPSPARLRAAICGSRTASDSGAVVIGVVRDARDRAPAAGVAVTGEWLELTFTAQGIVRRVPRRVARTGENGWFALCNVPGAGTVAIAASRGADSTDVIELDVPAERFLRRDLYLGAARTVVTGDTTQRTDTLAPSRRVRVGDGRLSGTVLTVANGRPLEGAQASISGGEHTRANERGEWTLVGAPAGTRMLEVRAVGYYPVRRAVDVLAVAGPQIRTSLFTLKAMLDTVKITAARLADRHASGFQDRRRTGVGRYVTAEDIARGTAFVTSDVFRKVPTVRVERRGSFEKIFLMRGGFSEWCSPAIYLDGHYMRDLSADDVDDLVSPKEIAGIEIYSETSVPPQFHPGLTECGAIVIWTK